MLSLDHEGDVELAEDGQQLDLPGAPIILHTPGHTEGHAMYHLPERGLLFSGDGLVTMDLLGDRGGPQLLEDRFTWTPRWQGSRWTGSSTLRPTCCCPGTATRGSAAPARPSRPCGRVDGGLADARRLAPPAGFDPATHGL